MRPFGDWLNVRSTSWSKSIDEHNGERKRVWIYAKQFWEFQSLTLQVEKKISDTIYDAILSSPRASKVGSDNHSSNRILFCQKNLQEGILLSIDQYFLRQIDKLQLTISSDFSWVFRVDSQAAPYIRYCKKIRSLLYKIKFIAGPPEIYMLGLYPAMGTKMPMPLYAKLVYRYINPTKTKKPRQAQ